MSLRNQPHAKTQVSHSYALGPAVVYLIKSRLAESKLRALIRCRHGRCSQMHSAVNKAVLQGSESYVEFPQRGRVIRVDAFWVMSFSNRSEGVCD